MLSRKDENIVMVFWGKKQSSIADFGGPSNQVFILTEDSEFFRIPALSIGWHFLSIQLTPPLEICVLKLSKKKDIVSCQKYVLSNSALIRNI